MRWRLIISILFIGIVAFAIESCEENGCGKTLLSSYDSHESEKMTGDCMNCHSPNGGAGSCFRIGGTAYDSILSDSSVQNSIVKIYSQPNGAGELITTMQVDRSGNFYTTSPVSFGSGLYPAIISGTGHIRYMPQSTVTGACNSCHGVTYPKIWAD
jgi:hypothetical protein